MKSNEEAAVAPGVQVKGLYIAVSLEQLGMHEESISWSATGEAVKEAYLSKNLRGRLMEGGCCSGSLEAPDPAGGHRMTTDMTNSASIPVAARRPVKLRGSQRQAVGCGMSSEETGGSGGSDDCA